MKQRPTSVTVIAWILLASSAITLVTSLTSMNDPAIREILAKSPLPLSVQYAFMYVGLTVSVVVAIALFKGKNWGRWLYTAWGAFGMVVSVATSPVKTMVIPGLIVFLLIVFFLFRPIANKYFASGGDSDALSP